MKHLRAVGKEPAMKAECSCCKSSCVKDCKKSAKESCKESCNSQS